MTFKRVTNWAPITLYASLGLLLLTSQIFAITWLIIAGDWSVLWSLGIGLGIYLLFGGVICLSFGLLAVMLSAFGVAGLVGQARRIHAIADNVYATERAQTQPDPALTLQQGESLRLAWHISARNTVRRAFSAFIIIPLIGVFGATTIFAILPGFRFSALNPVYDVIPLAVGQSYTTPSLLDWLALLCPFLWIAGLSATMWMQQRSGRRNVLTADDRGVTLEHGLRQRFMAWNDITAFVRLSPQDDTPVGGYFLGGKTRSFLISVARATTEDVHLNNQQMAQAVATARAAVQFEGGAATYEANARRLLATIAVRGHTPLSTFTSLPSLVVWLQRHFPQQFLRIRDATSAQLAGAPLQPTVAEIAAIPSAGLRVRLQARPGFWRVVWILALWIASLLALTVAAMAGALAPLPPLDLFSSGIVILGWSIAPNMLAAIVIGGGVFLCFSPAALVGAASTLGSRFPVIRADDIGVTRTTYGHASLVMILWSDVRAWGVIPPLRSGRRNARAIYLLFTDSGKLVWSEPTNAQLAGRRVGSDRRAAYQDYQEQAARLHALIVARTGLPLRDLTQGKTQ